MRVPGDRLAPATEVTCEFSLPGISLPLALEGRVAWHVGQDLGVAFDELDPALAELLETQVGGRA
jgi:hypothetical protein